MRDSGNQESEGTPEGLFNFEPEHIASDSDVEQHFDLPSLVVPHIYGLDPNPHIDEFSIRYLSQPKHKESNVGTIMRKFESDSKRCIHAAMRTSFLSYNPAEVILSGKLTGDG